MPCLLKNTINHNFKWASNSQYQSTWLWSNSCWTDFISNSNKVFIYVITRQTHLVCTVEEWQWCHMMPVFSAQDSPREQGDWFSVVVVKAVPSIHSSVFDRWQPSITALRHLSLDWKCVEAGRVRAVGWCSVCFSALLNLAKKSSFRLASIKM